METLMTSHRRKENVSRFQIKSAETENEKTDAQNAIST